MSRADTFNQIRKIVAQIPLGRVATYGQVAKLAGLKDARIVGWALCGNKNPRVPCHRVVKKEGFLAENYSLGGWVEQRARLQTEEVKFVRGKQVDLARCGWAGSKEEVC